MPLARLIIIQNIGIKIDMKTIWCFPIVIVQNHSSFIEILIHRMRIQYSQSCLHHNCGKVSPQFFLIDFDFHLGPRCRTVFHLSQKYIGSDIHLSQDQWGVDVKSYNPYRAWILTCQNIPHIVRLFSGRMRDVKFQDAHWPLFV